MGNSDPVVPAQVPSADDYQTGGAHWKWENRISARVRYKSNKIKTLHSNRINLLRRSAAALLRSFFGAFKSLVDAKQGRRSPQQKVAMA
jgi:hypothetical protein